MGPPRFKLVKSGHLIPMTLFGRWSPNMSGCGDGRRPVSILSLPELAAIVSDAHGLADPSDYVRLRDVYNRLKANRPKVAGRLVSYYRDEFSADLSCLLQHPKHRSAFEFSAARDPHLAFPVVLDDGTLNQYGYVRLRG